MSGSIPAWVGTLPDLEKLHFDGNKFSGEIPSSLGLAPKLEYLHLQGNNHLYGNISDLLCERGDTVYADCSSVIISCCEELFTKDDRVTITDNPL